MAVELNGRRFEVVYTDSETGLENVLDFAIEEMAVGFQERLFSRVNITSTLYEYVVVRKEVRKVG